MRIIIDFPDTNMTYEEALHYVGRVMRHGKVSESAGTAHFAWCTEFDGRIDVITRRKKNKDAADSFLIQYVPTPPP